MSAEAMQRKTPEQLHDEDVQRRALESAAARVERMAGSDVYQRAFKRAAETIREMKP